VYALPAPLTETKRNFCRVLKASFFPSEYSAFHLSTKISIRLWKSSKTIIQDELRKGRLAKQ